MVDIEYVNESISKKKRLRIMSTQLNSLPDAILVEILSFLPIHSAATTALVSRHWRHLWTHLTAVRLDLHSFFHHVISTLLRNQLADTCCPFPGVYDILKQLTSPVDVLEIHVPSSYRLGSCWKLYKWYFYNWIVQVFTRYNNSLRVFKIRFENGYNWLKSDLPLCVSQCPSLVELHLSNQSCGRQWWYGHDNICLPNLRKLIMSLNDTVMVSRFLDSCPLLEHLTLEGNYIKKDYIDITAPKLRCLSIRPKQTILKYVQVMIDAPKLESFYLQDMNNLSVYCFVRWPKSLAKASLLRELNCSCSPQYISKNLELLGDMSSVTSLTINGTMVQDLNNMVHAIVPFFPNLTQLRVINVKFPNQWKGLMHFLSCLPNLQVLDVSCGERKENGNETTLDSLPASLPTTMKTIKLRDFAGVRHELEIIRYFLRIAKVVDTLEIWVIAAKGAQLCKILGFCDEICKLCGRSSSCEINCSGDYVKISTKGLEDGATKRGNMV